MSPSKQSNARLVSSSRLFNFKVIDVVENSYVRENDPQPLKRIVVQHPGAVVILAKQDDGRLVLVRQFRHAVGEDLLEFPAGTLESGESPLDCARRELSEEVNLKAEKWAGLGHVYSSPGFCNEKLYFFCAEALGSQPGTPDEDEEFEIVTLSPAEVAEKIRAGGISDAKSIALFLRAMLTGFINY